MALLTGEHLSDYNFTGVSMKIQPSDVPKQGNVSHNETFNWDFFSFFFFFMFIQHDASAQWPVDERDLIGWLA